MLCREVLQFPSGSTADNMAEADVGEDVEEDDGNSDEVVGADDL